MTKSELIEQLTCDNDVLNKREAELIVNSIFDSIGQALVGGDRVEIRGFGSFTIRERDAREARNPKSGDIVQFAYENGGKRPARFSLKTWQLELNPPENSRLSKPVTQAPGLKITDWENKFTPKLNGKPLALNKYEMSRSLAIATDHKHFLLGTEWYLRLFDHTGKQLWEVDAPGPAWAVNISGDGRLATAGYADGTIRWYRLADGKGLLTFFLV